MIGRTLRISGTGDPGLLGRAADALADRAGPRSQDYRIVGVMSPRMTGTFTDTTDVWLPYEQAVPFLYGTAADQPQLDLGLSGNITITPQDGEPTRMRGLAVPVAGASATAVGDELNARLELGGQSFAGALNLTGAEMEFDVIETLGRHDVRLGRLERDIGEVKSDLVLLENRMLTQTNEILRIVHRLNEQDALASQN